MSNKALCLVSAVSRCSNIMALAYHSL